MREAVRVTPIKSSVLAPLALAALLLGAPLLGGCASGERPLPMANADGDNRTAEAANKGGGDPSEHRARAPGAAPQIASVYGDYLAGLFANKRQDLDAAADYMAKALAEDPDNAALLRQTFVLMTTQGRMETAASLARRMAETRADHGVAAVLRALEALKTGDPGAARTALSALPDRGLGALVQPLLSAWVDFAATGTAESVGELDGLSQIDGIEVLRHLHTALIHDAAGADAAAAYNKLATPTRALSLRLTWLLGNHYARTGQRDEMIAVYRRYLADHPESRTMRAVLSETEARTETPAPAVATAEQGMAEALFNLAGLLNQQNADDLALMYARLALHLRPDFPIGHMLVGEILEGKGRHDDAMTAYRAVPADSPFHLTARLRVTDSLQALGRNAAAIAQLREIAAAHPDHFEPLYRIGNIHRGTQRFEAAAEAYAEAESRLGEPQPQHWTLSYFHGIALERLDRWPEAEARFETALRLQPEQPHVMNYLAYSWVEQEMHLGKAQKMLEQAVAQRPEDGYIVDSMGWVSYRLGKFDKAVRYLERAVELRPQDAVINDHLGDAYWRVGRRQEARFQWHRALNLDPDPDVAERIETKLDNGLDARETTQTRRGDNG